MMYPYMKLGDGTEIVHSQIIEEEGIEKIEIHFERPTENGFDSIRFELPTYKIIYKEGNYTEEEIKFFEEFLQNNAHLLYKYAKNGGIKIA